MAGARRAKVAAPKAWAPKAAKAAAAKAKASAAKAAAAPQGAAHQSGLTHFDAAGAARMVDVGVKPESLRVAVASGTGVSISTRGPVFTASACQLRASAICAALLAP